MKQSKQILKAEDRLEKYMTETERYIEILKKNLIKKILILQQNRTTNESKIAELTNHFLN